MKGKVAIQSFKGRLRLCWSYQGQRYWLSLGLADNYESRLLAQQRANAIELDILSGNFDPTLNKYDVRKKLKAESLPLRTALDQWIGLTTKDLSTSSKNVYRFFGNLLITKLGDIPIKSLNSNNINKIVDEFKVEYKATVANKYNGFLKNFVSYCVDQGYCQAIWPKKVNRCKQLRDQPDPFTVEEVLAIKAASWDYEPYYAPLIEFLFDTGVRHGEAFGLIWQAINNGSCWIGKSLTVNYELKTTKTGIDRTIRLQPKLIKLLESLRGNPNSFVFVDYDGNPLNKNKFKNVWLRVIDNSKVRYRKPYNTRHTFISHALTSGIDPLLVAKLAGNSPDVIYKNYAGCIRSRSELPELY